MAACAVLACLVILAIVGPFFAPSSTGVTLGVSLDPPSLAHLMGTDQLGRDVFGRFCSGARISLALAAIVVAAGSVLGGLIAVVAGGLGGWVDSVLMRVMDSLMAFPPLLLAMAISIGLGAGLTAAAIGITITAVPWYARLLRADVVRVKGLLFVEAALSLGASKMNALRRHVIPHLSSTYLMQGAAIFSYTILTLAALSYIGLGAQDPTPEWGRMITDGQQYILTGQWWPSVFPGLGLVACTVALGVLADRLRDRFDPRGEGR
jgi:peptide/nickel transport system permease protein